MLIFRGVALHKEKSPRTMVASHPHLVTRLDGNPWRSIGPAGKRDQEFGKILKTKIKTSGFPRHNFYVNSPTKICSGHCWSRISFNIGILLHSKLVTRSGPEKTLEFLNGVDMMGAPYPLISSRVFGPQKNHLWAIYCGLMSPC